MISTNIITFVLLLLLNNEGSHARQKQWRSHQHLRRHQQLDNNGFYLEKDTIIDGTIDFSHLTNDFKTVAPDTDLIKSIVVKKPKLSSQFARLVNKYHFLKVCIQSNNVIMRPELPREILTSDQALAYILNGLARKLNIKFKIATKGCHLKFSVEGSKKSPLDVTFGYRHFNVVAKKHSHLPASLQYVEHKILKVLRRKGKANRNPTIILRLQELAMSDFFSEKTIINEDVKYAVKLNRQNINKFSRGIKYKIMHKLDQRIQNITFCTYGDSYVRGQPRLRTTHQIIGFIMTRVLSTLEPNSAFIYSKNKCKLRLDFTSRIPLTKPKVLITNNNIYNRAMPISYQIAMQNLMQAIHQNSFESTKPFRVDIPVATRETKYNPLQKRRRISIKTYKDLESWVPTHLKEFYEKIYNGGPPATAAASTPSPATAATAPTATPSTNPTTITTTTKTTTSTTTHIPPATKIKWPQGKVSKLPHINLENDHNSTDDNNNSIINDRDDVVANVDDIDENNNHDSDDDADDDEVDVDTVANIQNLDNVVEIESIPNDNNNDHDNDEDDDGDNDELDKIIANIFKLNNLDLPNEYEGIYDENEIDAKVKESKLDHDNGNDDYDNNDANGNDEDDGSESHNEIVYGNLNELNLPSNDNYDNDAVFAHDINNYINKSDDILAEEEDGHQDEEEYYRNPLALDMPDAADDETENWDLELEPSEDDLEIAGNEHISMDAPQSLHLINFDDSNDDAAEDDDDDDNGEDDNNDHDDHHHDNDDIEMAGNEQISMNNLQPLNLYASKLYNFDNVDDINSQFGDNMSENEDENYNNDNDGGDDDGDDEGDDDEEEIVAPPVTAASTVPPVAVASTAPSVAAAPSVGNAATTPTIHRPINTEIEYFDKTKNDSIIKTLFSNINYVFTHPMLNKGLLNTTQFILAKPIGVLKLKLNNGQSINEIMSIEKYSGEHYYNSSLQQALEDFYKSVQSEQPNDDMTTTTKKTTKTTATSTPDPLHIEHSNIITTDPDKNLAKAPTTATNDPATNKVVDKPSVGVKKTIASMFGDSNGDDDNNANDGAAVCCPR